MAKRIVFLADCLVTQKAGIHFYAKQFISRTINQYPHNQYFIVLPHPYNELDAEEIIVPIRPWLPLHFRFRYYTSIPKAVLKLKPDLVVEMAHFGPFGLPKSIKQITIIHDLTPILYPEWHGRLSTLMHKILLPGILNRADNIITNSVQTKNDIIEYMPGVKDKIEVAYPKIASKKSTASSIQNRNKTKASYMLAVGTIEPRKNYTLLIKAFNELAIKHPEIQLRIVGYKGWKSNDFFDLINKSKFKNRIFLEGYTSEERLKELYENAYAFIFPSLYEGFGLPLLEAMGFGLPILCSDLETSKEICGNAAMYFSKTDEQELVRLMMTLLQNPAERNLLHLKSLKQFDQFNSQKLELDALFK